MKWIGISGSGRGITPEIEQDVRTAVRGILEDGDGIVTGGVLGVDYLATEEAMRSDPSGARIKVCIPATLDTYLAHFRARRDIAPEEADALESQLRGLWAANPASIVEPATPPAVVDRTAYQAKNDKVVELSDALRAFQVNKSAGTQYTMDQAAEKGIPITLSEYTT